MDFSDSRWQELVGSFTSSLAGLQETASGIVRLTVQELDVEETSLEVVDAADRHLENSRQLENYLAERLVEDAQARNLMGRIASIDFEVAASLDGASEEPDVAILAFAETGDALDLESIRADLLGLDAIRGGQAAPAPIDVVQMSCDEVLDKAGKCATDLTGHLAGAVTTGETLDGIASVVGGGAAEAIERLKDEVKLIKRKVLDFVNAAISKLGKLLVLDVEKIKEELKHFLEKVRHAAGDWIADALGRSGAVSAWRTWLDGQPQPADFSVGAALRVVDGSKESHQQQLGWACKAVWVFGKLAKWGATLKPAGPPVVAIVAGGLGGWLAWTTWDFLHEVEAAAA